MNAPLEQNRRLDEPGDYAASLKAAVSDRKAFLQEQLDNPQPNPGEPPAIPLPRNREEFIALLNETLDHANELSRAVTKMGQHLEAAHCLRSAGTIRLAGKPPAESATIGERPQTVLEGLAGHTSCISDERARRLEH